MPEGFFIISHTDDSLYESSISSDNDDDDDNDDDWEGNLHLNLGLASVWTNPTSEPDPDCDEDEDDQEGKLNSIGPLDWSLLLFVVEYPNGTLILVISSPDVSADESDLVQNWFDSFCLQPNESDMHEKLNRLQTHQCWHTLFCVYVNIFQHFVSGIFNRGGAFLHWLEVRECRDFFPLFV